MRRSVRCSKVCSQFHNGVYHRIYATVPGNHFKLIHIVTHLLWWWVLLGDISLSTALECLTLVMLQVSLLLLSTITCQTCNGTSESARDAVRDTRSQIAQLSLSLLLFTRSVLLGTFLLEGLDACEVSERLLG